MHIYTRKGIRKGIPLYVLVGGAKPGDMFSYGPFTAEPSSWRGKETEEKV
jgi:hypothetical protein